MKQGFEIYQDYTKQGFQAKEERDARITELEKKKEEAEVKRDNFRKLRDEAEEPEREAIETHKKAWEGWGYHKTALNIHDIVSIAVFVLYFF